VSRKRQEPPPLLDPPRKLRVTVPGGRVVEVTDYGAGVIIGGGAGGWVGEEDTPEYQAQLLAVHHAVTIAREASLAWTRQAENREHASLPRRRRRPSKEDVLSFVQSLPDYDPADHWPRNWRYLAALHFGVSERSVSRALSDKETKSRR